MHGGHTQRNLTPAKDGRRSGPAARVRIEGRCRRLSSPAAIAQDKHGMQESQGRDGAQTNPGHRVAVTKNRGRAGFIRRGQELANPTFLAGAEAKPRCSVKSNGASVTYYCRIQVIRPCQVNATMYQARQRVTPRINQERAKAVRCTRISVVGVGEEKYQNTLLAIKRNVLKDYVTPK